jgi:hypothetical protein
MSVNSDIAVGGILVSDGMGVFNGGGWNGRPVTEGELGAHPGIG